MLLLLTSPLCPTNPHAPSGAYRSYVMMENHLQQLIHHPPSSFADKIFEWELEINVGGWRMHLRRCIMPCVALARDVHV